jgi:hypothetical protein
MPANGTTASDGDLLVTSLIVEYHNRLDEYVRLAARGIPERFSMSMPQDCRSGGLRLNQPALVMREPAFTPGQSSIPRDTQLGSEVS